jgi:hypothetical protein
MSHCPVTGEDHDELARDGYRFLELPPTRPDDDLCLYRECACGKELRATWTETTAEDLRREYAERRVLEAGREFGDGTRESRRVA